ncbi:MAG: MazG family protein [Clostridia bacterium]|nr:MazG family protein [Clostridia bacterium]
MKLLVNTVTVDEGAFLNMPIVDTSLALCVMNIADFDAVKNKLLKLYGDVAVQTESGESTISELSGAKEIFVAAQTDFAKRRYNAADALRVIARLTLPEGGCPWDRAQTHDSIRINMIEEAYEAVDAINKRDVPNMREEFGDVFLQSILQSDIAKRAGEFDFDDVCDELCKKLISRHTFIFGDDSAGNPDEALNLWEKAKATEKNYDSAKTQLQKLPETFPALLYCQKTIKKMGKAGVKYDADKELAAALEAGDYVSAVCACVAKLLEVGADAEVEVCKKVKSMIESL